MGGGTEDAEGGGSDVGEGRGGGRGGAVGLDVGVEVELNLLAGGKEVWKWWEED